MQRLIRPLSTRATAMASSTYSSSSLSESIQEELSELSWTSQDASKPNVLVTAPIPPEGEQILAQAANLLQWPHSDRPMSTTTIEQAIAGKHGLVCLLNDKIPASVINNGRDTLKVISTMSVGFEHVDLAAAKEAGIPVGNTPGVLTETTADLCFALLMATARNLPYAIDSARNGEWGAWSPLQYCGPDVYGSTVGIIGLGRIGMAFARRCSGFGMKILYWSPSAKPEEENELPALTRVGDVSELLKEADFVVPHCALNEHTKGMFDAQAFATMKSSAIFINTTRGGLVDQDALVEALANGEIAGAGLDVTTPEPLPVDHPLFHLDNVVVLPHIGSASVPTRTKMSVMAAENCLAGLKGDALPHPV